MEYHISTNILFAVACLIYIFSGIFCGFVRWRHMCRPYDQDGEFFYPARKQATFFFSAIVLQFPYLLDPADEEIWMYIRAFGILYYPVCFSLLFRRYFRKERLRHNKWSTACLVLSFVLISGMLGLVLLHRGDLLVGGDNVFLSAMGVIGALLVMNFLQVAKWLKCEISRFHRDNYSNEEDFPYLFAKKVLYSPLIWIFAMWLIFIIGNRWVKFYVDIACAFWMVYFLTTILHPHIVAPIPEEDNKESVEDNGNGETGVLEDTYTEAAIRDEVLTVMLQKYKNPHLLKPQILDEFSYGKKKEANDFISKVGYYNFVNMLRLEHARLYKEAHPSATQDEIAEASGFTSRYALYRAQKNVEWIDPDLVSRVNIND